MNPHTVKTEEAIWLIWSNEHRAWWRAERCGYTSSEVEAGRYTLREASVICRDGGQPRSWSTETGPYEIMVLAPEFVANLTASIALPPVSGAARDIIEERARQITAEGWTPEHDEHHPAGELARAAAFYCVHWAAQFVPEFQEIDKPFVPATRYSLLSHADAVWPWAPTERKPKDNRRDLVRAGALIMAEIERLDRANAVSAEDEATELCVGCQKPIPEDAPAYHYRDGPVACADCAPTLAEAIVELQESIEASEDPEDQEQWRQAIEEIQARIAAGEDPATKCVW